MDYICTTNRNQYAIPCYFQNKPHEHSLVHWWVSPRASRESRRKWAAKWNQILQWEHKRRSPDSAVVIKFRDVLTDHEINAFEKVLYEKVKYVRTNPRCKYRNADAGVFLIHEIEPNNKIHIHGLIRGIPNFEKLVFAAAKKVGINVSFWEEEPESVGAWSAYILKTRRNDTLMFSASKIRVAKHWGYFSATIAEIWAEIRVEKRNSILSRRKERKSVYGQIQALPRAFPAPLQLAPRMLPIRFPSPFPDTS